MTQRTAKKTPNAPIRSYRDLAVWQLGMELSVVSYKLARKLPPTEKYELASQIRRASVSVPANIAEGYGRRHLGDYLRHLYIANGSLKELETELELAQRLEYLSRDDAKAACQLADQLGRMLASLSRRLAAFGPRRHSPIRPRPKTQDLRPSVKST
jgi:four helix bundle protein